MYQDEIIERVKRNALTHVLKKTEENKTYVCPVCNHPRIYKPMNGAWYCQRCKAKGNVFHARAYQRGIPYSYAFREVMETYKNVEFQEDDETNDSVHQNESKDIAASEEWLATCKSFCLRAHDSLEGSEAERYLTSRGFTPETMNRFCLGYDKYYGGACIIPYSRALDYYCKRLIHPVDNHHKTWKPSVNSAGTEPIFNAGALYHAEKCLIVEGQFDAMAICQSTATADVNISAVALCGTGGARLVNLLQSRPATAQLFIALDNDEAGRIAAKDLSERLSAISQPHILLDSAKLYGGCKDANDLLIDASTEMGLIICSALEAA